MTKFMMSSCDPVYKGLFLTQISNWCHVKTIADSMYKIVIASCACADVSEILSIGVWKCSFRTLNQNIKIYLKNSKPSWRYKQYVNWINTKWKISMKRNAQGMAQNETYPFVMFLHGIGQIFSCFWFLFSIKSWAYLYVCLEFQVVPKKVSCRVPTLIKKDFTVLCLK